MSDYNKYQYATIHKRWKQAQFEAATTDLERAIVDERMAELLSQHEPAASIGVNREHLRQVISYIQNGSMEATK